jgi:hypothetical protein
MLREKLLLVVQLIFSANFSVYSAGPENVQRSEIRIQLQAFIFCLLN